jgi:hypothetical protein
MGDSAHTPTIQTWEKISTAPFSLLFLEDENIFQKSASVVQTGIAIEFVPRRVIFEKCSHLREKGPQ